MKLIQFSVHKLSQTTPTYNPCTPKNATPAFSQVEGDVDDPGQEVSECRGHLRVTNKAVRLVVTRQDGGILTQDIDVAGQRTLVDSQTNPTSTLGRV